MAAAQVLIREGRDDDTAAILGMVERAFGRHAEADLVAALLQDPVATLSVVAEDGGTVVGHALLSGLEGIEGGMALAPVAVAPERQGCGIGSAVIRAALELAGEEGYRAVFVLGEPDYYGRFGFRAELARGFDVPWAGPYFMALELVPGAIADHRGALTYAAPFSALE